MSGFVRIDLVSGSLSLCLLSAVEGGAEETAVKEALQVVYSSAQRDYEDLEGATVAACQGL